MLSRRGFILTGAAVGGGLIAAFGWRSLDDGDAALRFSAYGIRGTPLNAWLKIDPGGNIVCAIARAEMGQGVTTSLAMLLAEELDADWSQVRFEFAPVDRDYYNFGMLLRGQPLGDPAAGLLAATGTWAIRQVFWAIGLSMTISSSSTVDGWDTLRPAGASARQMLINAAARQWSTGAAELRTESGYVIDDAQQRRASFGELAEAASREQPARNITLKQKDEFRIIGTNPPRLDTPMKITGTATFGIDVVRPGMLYGTVVHSPVAGTRVARFDTNGAEALPGVEYIGLAGEPGKERAVAVVAGNTWQALQAARQIRVESAPPVNGRVYTAGLRERYLAQLEAPELVSFRDDGDSGAALAGADTVIEAVYELPYLAHVCMEPMNCTALFSGDALEIWAPSQAHTLARDIGAAICELHPGAVTVHTTFMGGGFGRRAEMDYVKEAVSVARALPGRPVKLTWSREEDVRHDAFRPAAVAKISGAVSADAKITALDYRLATQSVTASYESRTPTPRGGNAESDSSAVTAVNPPVYPVENIRVLYAPIDAHMPAGFWRSVSHSWNTFFIECFVDELAAAAGVDPLEFRRRACRANDRHLAVLDAVGGAGPAGYALAESHNTVVAHRIEVAATNGEFERVTRVACAIDCGPVIHPDNVRAQMESSIVDGLSAALYGRVDIDDGMVLQGNFDSYRRLQLADMPDIDIMLIDTGETRPGGVGEPGLPGVAPALVNAIFATTGQRIRSLPVITAANS